LPWLPAHPAATTPAQAQQLQDAELAELTTSLTGVLRRADELDTTLAAALTAAASGQVDDGTGTALFDAAVHVLGGDRPPPAPPPDATPGQNAAWWASLTPAQREHLLLTDPGLIANRDGLPAAVRDQANRARLDTEAARIDADIAATQARIDALPPPAKVRFGGIDQLSERLELGNELAELHDQRDALATVTETIAVDPDNRQLLVLDLNGNDEPRAAVAVGDVSTADHVAVLTPGFTTTVADSLPAVTNDVSALRENALNQLRDDDQPAATVAAVAWLGYDIPQFDTVVSSDRSVFDDDAAHEGGHALDRFLDGIATARPDHDPHLTALGHSYGSTTTGFALQETTSVDDAVIFGSPGASTGDLTQLNVPPGHLSVIEARGDVVADAGLFGPDPNQLDLTNLSAEAASTPDGTPLSEATGHSGYLAAGSTSQHNLGATVAGLPGNRIFADDNSGFGDWLRGKAPS
jgi:hypothetical protein